MAVTVLRLFAVFAALSRILLSSCRFFSAARASTFGSTCFVAAEPGRWEVVETPSR